jgi:hypothetical protein
MKAVVKEVFAIHMYFSRIKFASIHRKEFYGFTTDLIYSISTTPREILKALRYLVRILEFLII